MAINTFLCRCFFDILIIFLWAIGIFSIFIDFDKSPLSIRKLFANLKNLPIFLTACLDSILKILFSLGRILLNLLISSTVFVNDNAKFLILNLVFIG